jgi:pimeloyl-ACP methyl ester carboxylesterase
MVLLAVLIAGAMIADPASAQIRYDKRRVMAEDSLAMFVKFFHGYADETTPLWVLLPMMGHDHLSYAEFREEVWTQLREDTLTPALRRPYILSPDLRGHGNSTRRGTDTLSYETMPESEFDKYVSDVTLMIENVVVDETHRVSGDSIYVVGASIGANTAALLTTEQPNIQRLALLSPGLDYRGLKPYKALQQFEGEVLIYVSEKDQYSLESSRKLAAIAPDRFELQVFPGAHHGTDIINNNEEAMEDLVTWLLAPQREEAAVGDSTASQ